MPKLSRKLVPLVGSVDSKNAGKAIECLQNNVHTFVHGITKLPYQYCNVKDQKQHIFI